MESHVKSSLFLYVPATEELIDQVVANPFNTKIIPILLREFLNSPEQYLQQCNHVVVAAPLDKIKSVMALNMGHDFTIGLLPTKDQKNLRNCYGLPKRTEDALEIALQTDAQVMDVILCNKHILVFKAAIGRLPLIDSSRNITLIRAALNAFRGFRGLRLLPFKFVTESGKVVKTAASGCMIVQHHEHTLASRLISHDSSLTDGMISMVITAPTSIIAYFNFLYQTLRCRGQRKRIPSTIGYIKSSTITIETEEPFEVTIDEVKITQTPLHCETIPRAVCINVGKGLRESVKNSTKVHERIEIKNLPAGKELAKASKKRISFFSYASEDRFRDLFISLRDDASLQPTYLVLMVLSTMLAAIGLYQSSSAVVIGAMLLAPLMAPIVALSMGLLRHDTKLSKTSMITILVGVCIALTAASLISLLFPHKPITMEMQARLHPSLLDLGVAIVAGVAGAYTKSNKKILQSLAGVSIAVALVPPLAVAGIGLGMGDLSFFGQAFLLFSTNLVGITLAATFTFRLLGYSPVV
ncbi:MAG: TIGR00341 family protein, partial [Desulfocapsa sp.]|nr:TIGR00341 family protein [Desulfocapsa sp.]